MREFWLDVKDIPNYEVSNLGNVRNKKTGRVLQQMLSKKEDGYLRVNIGGKHKYIHRLVADAFFDGDHSGMCVNHIDGNKLNNHISNLEWCDTVDNVRHAQETGLRYPVVKNVVRCKFCKNRYNFYICDGKDDDFYCAYGER